MSDLAIDLTTGDLKLSADGDLILVDGTAAILQDVLTALRMVYGEWFLDTTAGLDYFGQILVKNPDQSKIDALFISTILSVPGVIQLNSYSSSPNMITRMLTISFNALTTDGVVDYSGTVTVGSSS